MGVVTVIGASGASVQVTVDGGQAQVLAQSYADQIATAFQRGLLKSANLKSGDNTAEDLVADTVFQGVVTTGGAYNVYGGYSNLLVGVQVPNDADPDAPLPPLSAPVTINAAGVTAAFLDVLSGDVGGVDFTAGDNNGSFTATFGDNVFHGEGRIGNWSIVTGSGNDTIFGTNGNDVIDAGTGNNRITLGTGTNVVSLRGNDTLDGILSSRTNVTIFGGSSELTLGVNSYVQDSGTSGSKISAGNFSSVKGGQGSNVSFTGATGSVYGALADTISAVGNLYVEQGLNQSISVDGALTFINGSGATSITSHDGTVWGASSLNLTLDVSGRLIYTTNQPGSTGNQTVNASGSTGWVEFWSGPGSQELTGGSGFNHFVFGTAFEGISGDSHVTVTAAQGKSDFGVLRGHSGGHITINDFLSNADNKFFMYNYKPVNAAEEVQKLLNTATVSGNNTTITLDNNMTVTFVGINHLNASNFEIS